MPKQTKTAEELQVELNEQLLALRTSNINYDEGNRWEAKRLATTLHILLHDSRGGRSKSLLGVLGLRGQIELPSSISKPSKAIELIGWDSRRGLVIARTHYPHAYYAPKLDPCDEVYRCLKFEHWYEEVIFRGLNGATVSRKNLIHYMRSQDGGAHVDTHLTDEGYAFWKSNGDPYLSYEVEHDPPCVSIFGAVFDFRTGTNIFDAPVVGKSLKYATHAATRQIAWEVDFALKQLGY